MPWGNRGIMSLREEFVSEVKNKIATISELCRKYNISRPTGYKWLLRYEQDGLLGLEDRSKKPLRIPLRTSENQTKLILEARDKNPAWGAKKLRQVLLNEGHRELPSQATFNRILKRLEKVSPSESGKREKYIRFERKNPNELWQMDFKGHFALKEGRCHPLTILDDCSRYSICLKACSGEDEVSVRSGLEEAFHRYGLPDAMTMDNGNPWKGTPPRRLTRLTIWLMRYGIKIGHSRPYHPQTQGKDERFHRTLKEELLKYHNFRDLSEAQSNFNEWRNLYNEVRPHEALGMLCPANKYRPSIREYREKPPAIEYEARDEVRKVSSAGEVKFKGEQFYLAEYLSGESVAFRQRGERKWDIYYVSSWLGSFEEKV